MNSSILNGPAAMAAILCISSGLWAAPAKPVRAPKSLPVDTVVPPWAAPGAQPAAPIAQPAVARDTSDPASTYAEFLGIPPETPMLPQAVPEAEASASSAPAPIAPTGPEAPAPIAPAQGRMGFAGFFQGRLHAHQLGDHPAWLAPDAAGNSLKARLGLQVYGAADAHVTGRASLTFNDDLSGRFLNTHAGRSPRRVVIPGIGEGPDTATGDALHHPQGPTEGNGIFEDLVGEAELRSPLVDAKVSAGTTLWLQGSPLTLWNRDSRPERAWHYEDFEPEMSAAEYQSWKALGRDRNLGRHDWTRRPLAGLALETARMAGGFSIRAAWADPSALLPTETSGSTTRAEGPAGLLDGDGLGSHGSLWHLRLARAWKAHEAGLNVLTTSLPRDLIHQRDPSSATPRGFAYQFRDGKAPRFVNPRIASLEYAGPLGTTLDIRGEVALSLDDTVRYLPVTGSPATFDGRSGIQHLRGPPAPAAWLRATSRGSLNLETELFYAAPAFRSPWSMVRSGLQAHRDGSASAAGAAQYRDNLLGLDIRLAPTFTSGFLVFRAGQHVQVEPGPDLLRFEHSLNGRDLWEASTSVHRADGALPLDQGYGPGAPRYESRLGVTSKGLPLYGAAQNGGFTGGDRMVNEEFAVFQTKAQADSGLTSHRRKFSSSLSLDWGIPLDGRFDLTRPALLNLLGSLGAVGLDPTALVGPSRALLWTGRFSAEPSFAVTDDFHFLALAGVETWKSRHAWRNTLANRAVAGEFNNRIAYDPLSSLSPTSQGALPRIDAAAAPIDYLQWAVGAGCDWDIAARTGLHLRIKHARHRDATVPSNGWSATFLFLELKSWI